MAGRQKVVYCPSNGAIYNALEQPQNKISRSCHSLTLNISDMAKDTAVVTMDCEQETIT